MLFEWACSVCAKDKGYQQNGLRYVHLCVLYTTAKNKHNVYM